MGRSNYPGLSEILRFILVTAIIVLTGGIASGKTAVSTLFEHAGIAVIDTDITAREVVAVGSEGLQQIQAHFGNTIIQTNGQLNRKALKDIVFNDEKQKRQLEAILHPLIRVRVQQQIDALQQHCFIILVVPLYIESGQHYKADKVLVVDVPVEMQLERLLLRDGVDVELANKIIQSQASREQRLEIADDVIQNKQGMENLEKKVAQLIQLYKRAYC